MNRKNHLKRVLTALLLLPVLILIVYLGRGWLFNALIIGCIFICIREYFSLMDQGGMPCFKSSGILISIGLIIVFIIRRPEWILFMITAALLFLFLNAIASGQPMSETVPRLSVTLLGLIYVPWMMSFLILIRGFKGGAYLIFFLLAVIWSGDTFAYYTGSLMGRHLLCQRISPKKTVEGMLGGLGGSILAASLAGHFWLPRVSWFVYPLTGLTLGAIGQLGDLSESILKRWAGAKESGAILPGHGGLLDRIDGLIFSAPVFYFLLLVIIGYTK